MAYTYIQRSEDAGGLAADLETASRIALDCEAAGFHRYSDSLCLLQVTTSGGTYVVDPLSFDPTPLLKSVLEDPGVEIVMHGADYDLRLLDRDLGIRLNALFDTQVAASLLGLDQLGLAALLAERFGVKLSKKYQRADWADRPLSDGMLEYAAADTHHLLELADQLSAELANAGRAHWAEEECRALEANALDNSEPEEPVDPVTRVKGARDLGPRQAHALRVALEWRDELARERDRAPFRVIGDQPLVEVVALLPRRAEALRDIKGFPGGLAGSEGKELLRRLHAIKDLADDEIEPYPRRRGGGPGRPTPEVEALADRLKRVRNRRAGELSLERGTLVSNAVLLEIARAAPTTPEDLAAVDGVRAWHVEVMGGAMLEEIRRRG